MSRGVLFWRGICIGVALVNVGVGLVLWASVGLLTRGRLA